MEVKSCYICNTQSVLYSKNLLKTKSKYSNTSLGEFIDRLLGSSPSSRSWNTVDDEYCVCITCNDKINEYDRACWVAERVENELREVLLHTESLFNDGAKAKLFLTKIEPIESLDVLVQDYTNEENSIEEIDADFIENEELRIYEEHLEEEDEKISDEKPINTKDDKKDLVLKCIKCDMTFDNMESLSQHKIHSNHKQLPYKCASCTQEFTSRTQLENHKRQHKDEEDQFKCSLCGLNLKEKAALDVHHGLHQNLPSLQCVLCNKDFKKKGALVRHMRIHSGLTFYQCDRCGKEFIHKSSFEMHILAHDDIRKKQCPHCDRWFRSTSHLNRHLRIHTGAKPFHCPICHQKFAQRYNMSVHQRLHDTSADRSKIDKKHVCTFCSTTFARKSTLHQHYQKNHGTTIPHTAIGNELHDSNEVKVPLSHIT